MTLKLSHLQIEFLTRHWRNGAVKADFKRRAQLLFFNAHAGTCLFLGTYSKFLG